MNDSASVTSSSLAVAEKKPRSNGGCVGIFFQLFDWNRRFTKKKLFSKRLLPPDRVKEASKKFGGDDKLPRLRLIDDENSGGFLNNNKNGANGVQTPTLVARLMGLESMPPVNRNQLPKDDRDKFHEKVVGENGEFRPQKVQKTGTVDRKSVTRFGSEALQLKNVLSQSRKHHHPKLASPVKSASHHTKRNTSRLIGAATRILEPGLQARNKSRYIISYGRDTGGAGAPLAPRPLRHGLRSEPVKNEDLDNPQVSCKTCGNLIDISMSTSNPHSHSTYLKENNRDQLKFNSFPSTDSEEFVGLNSGLTGRTQSRATVKVNDMKFESACVSRVSPKQTRQVTHTRRQGTSCNIPKMVKNAQSSKKQTGSDDLQPNYPTQVVNKFSDDGMTFRFGSSINNQNASPCKTISRKRFTSNTISRKRSTVAGYESGINGNPPKTISPFIFDNLLCTISRNHEQCTRFRLQPIKSDIIRIIGDHVNRGSVLEASFSNDSCCSSSLEDSSTRTQHADSMSYSYDDESRFQESETDPFYSDLSLRTENTRYKLVANLQTYISQVLCSMDLVNFKINKNIKDVIFNSELVLANQMLHNPNEINSFFICDLILELDAVANVMQTRYGNFLGSQNSNARYQLKRFVFDSLIEYLELKYVRYAKCGFRSWMNLPQFMGFNGLILEVVDEVRRWMCVTLDELLVGLDMSHGSRKWLDFEIEAYETGAKVELEIIQTLINEIVIDICTN